MAANRESFLNAETKALILQTLYDGGALCHLARRLKVSNQAIYQAIKRDPLFAQEVAEARLSGVDVIVESTLTMVEDCGDAHMARVKSDNAWRYAAAMNRAKYGEKVDLRIEQTVSIETALSLAAGRVAPLLQEGRDVTEIEPVAVETIDDLL